MNNHVKKDHQVVSGRKTRKILIPKEPFITPTFIHWIPDKSGYEMVWFFKGLTFAV